MRPKADAPVDHGPFLDPPPEWLEVLSPGEIQLLEPAQPGFRRPMLAQAHEGDLPQDDWLLERKLDGYRMQVVGDGHDVRLWSRNGLDATDRYPEVVAGLVPRPMVLDGEVVVFVDGRDDFGALQARVEGRSRAPAQYVAFDILHLDGLDLGALPLAARRRVLTAVRPPGAAILPAGQGDPLQWLQRACDAGWEGIVAKRADAAYQARRSPAWRKLKCQKEQEFVVAGLTPPRGGRTGFGALLLGTMKEGGLRYAGKVGTGFDQATLVRLHDALMGLRQDATPLVDPPREPAVWTRPRLVVRVAFTQWTRDGRLRHPRFLGVRSDKAPDEVTRET